MTNKTPDEIIQELHELVGEQFPLTIDSFSGSLRIKYDTEWKEGGTRAKETISKETGEKEITYLEQYTEKKLTKEQIKKIDDYIAEVTQ